MSAEKTDKSHPYIIAQQNKKRSANNQAIGSSSSSSSSFTTKRKRKFSDTFEDDEDGQYEYTQSLIINPPSKKHITEQTVMKSIR